MVVGVSPDGAETQRRFRDANALPFDLIPDTDKRIARLYDVRRRLGLGASRVTYVIDRAGLVRLAHHGEVSMGGHVRAVLTALRTLAAAGGERPTPRTLA